MTAGLLTYISVSAWGAWVWIFELVYACCATWIGIICNLRGYSISPCDWRLSRCCTKKTICLLHYQMTATLAWKSNEAFLNLGLVHVSVQCCAWKCWSQGKGPSLALVHCVKGTVHTHTEDSWGQMESLCSKSGWCQTRHEECRLPPLSQ